MEISGDEMKRIRHKLGLSTVQLGRALGYVGSGDTASMSIRRYESGGRPIPPWIGRLCLMFERYGVPEDWTDSPPPHKAQAERDK